jgi:hypothetical protein
MSKFTPGTILAFSGNYFKPDFPWLDVSGPIRIRGGFTPWSHIGIIVDITAEDVDAAIYYAGLRYDGRYDYARAHPPGLCLLESTTMLDCPCLVTGDAIPGGGVQCNLPHNRINGYNGRVASMRPRVELTERQRARLARYALGIAGRPYDARGAALMGTFCWKYLRGRRAADRQTYVCCELVTEANIKLRWPNTPKPLKPGFAMPASVVEWHEDWTHHPHKWEPTT